MDLLNNKIDQKNVLKRLQSIASFFEYHFVKKTMKYTYFKGKNIRNTVNIRFSPGNFQHLVGVKYDLGANKFWEHVIIGNVSWKSVKLTSHSKIRPNLRRGDTRTNFEKKLNAMSAMNDILSSNARILEDGSVYGVVYKHLIRTNRQTIGLATRSDNTEQEFFISTMDLTGLIGHNYKGYVLDEISSYMKDEVLCTCYFKRDIVAQKAKSKNKIKYKKGFKNKKNKPN